MAVDDVCRHLDWDSRFFGCRIARVTASRLDPQGMERILRWCHEQRVDCLYFLADASHADTTRLAEDNGFRLVDVRVTLERHLEDGSRQDDAASRRAVRLCLPDDVDGLRSIARMSHRDSRFYYDGRFPEAACDALYETWIERSCEGYADAVLVAGPPGHPIGYLSCHMAGDAEGQIGLVGVSAEMHGKGVGGDLLMEALRWFAGQGAKRVTVVTQGRNCPAQRLYQRQGFRTAAVQLWYHRWFQPSHASRGG